MDDNTPQRQALLLVATESDWAGRSLESVLTHHGYAVLRPQTGHDALDLARRTRPDAVVLDEQLPSTTGMEVCRQLRDDPAFDPATPVVLIGSPTSHVERTAAYAAGVWTYCTQPLDAEILVAQLSTFIRAKRAVTSAREQSLVDATTGLLSPVGMERWAEQLAARAVRNHEPLACVVLMAPAGSTAADSAEVAEVAAAFIESSRAHMRRSDIVGRTSDGRLALLAPDTDSDGVLGLVQRLRNAIESAAENRAEGRKSAEFRAGYCAIEDFGAAEVSPSELMRRAMQAVDHASRSNGDLALNFNQLPIN
jgi:DNA-binding response OmpR family regulator